MLCTDYKHACILMHACMHASRICVRIYELCVQIGCMHACMHACINELILCSASARQAQIRMQTQAYWMRATARCQSRALDTPAGHHVLAARNSTSWRPAGRCSRTCTPPRRRRHARHLPGRRASNHRRREAAKSRVRRPTNAVTHLGAELPRPHTVNLRRCYPC